VKSEHPANFFLCSQVLRFPQKTNVGIFVFLQVKRGELAKEMCGLISILSGLIEDKTAVKDMTNITEKMEQHMRRISEGLKGKSTQVKEVNKNCYFV
jgi:hypothetical protein